MTSLTNQFLIALPDMQDERFKNALILICDHNADGALGLVVNKPSELNFSEVLESLSIGCDYERVNQSAVCEGGPVNRECGFVIHSGITNYQSSIRVGNTLALTTSKDIIKDISKNNVVGPWLFCLGCASWTAGQLEQEILNNVWLTADVKDDIIFSAAHEKKWSKALSTLGIQAHQLSGDFGHA